MYYVYVTNRTFTAATARRIAKRIHAIDPTAEMVGPLSIPGQSSTGLIERPNDGTNDYNAIRQRNQKIAAIARDLIEGPGAEDGE